MTDQQMQGDPSRQSAPARPLMDRRLLFSLIIVCVLVSLCAALVSAFIFGDGLSSLPAYLRAPDGEVLQIMGAGGRAPMLRGEYWTLIASAYLHGDISHLGLNMVGLLFLIPPVQTAFGLQRTFLIYTIACITGSLASALWGEIYSLGASTGIFGLIGAMLVAGLVAGGALGRAFLIQSVILVIVNLSMGFANPGQISNAGHIGGLIGGVIGAWLMLRTGSPRGLELVKAGTLVALAATFLSVGIAVGTGGYRAWQTKYEPNDLVRFIMDRRASDQAIANGS